MSYDDVERMMIALAEIERISTNLMAADGLPSVLRGHVKEIVTTAREALPALKPQTQRERAITCLSQMAGINPDSARDIVDTLLDAAEERLPRLPAFEHPYRAR